MSDVPSWLDLDYVSWPKPNVSTLCPLETHCPCTLLIFILIGQRDVLFPHFIVIILYLPLHIYQHSVKRKSSPVSAVYSILLPKQYGLPFQCCIIFMPFIIFLSTSLLSKHKICSSCNFPISAPSSEIRYFSKKPKLLLVGNTRSGFLVCSLLLSSLLLSFQQTDQHVF